MRVPPADTGQNLRPVVSGDTLVARRERLVGTITGNDVCGVLDPKRRFGTGDRCECATDIVDLRPLSL